MTLPGMRPSKLALFVSDAIDLIGTIALVVLIVWAMCIFVGHSG